MQSVFEISVKFFRL